MQKDNLLICFNLDSVSYKTKKQAAANMGAIKKRLADPKHRGNAAPEDLIKAIENGQAFNPGFLTGTTADTWEKQQIICLDIDNQEPEKDAGGNKVIIQNPLTPDLAADVLSRWGVEPYFMYYTYSSAEEWPRFRIVFILDEPLTDRALKTDYVDRLNNILEYMTPGSTDNTARLDTVTYLGSTPGSCFNITKNVITAADLSQLPPAPKKEEPLNIPAETRKEQPAPKASGYNSAELDNLNAQLHRDIETFDIASYVIDNYGGKIKKAGNSIFINPCPICGHNDDFNIKPGKGFKCFGAGGGDAGNIINLICAVEGKSKPEAMEKFKFDIMRYDREEWEAAFKKSINKEAQADQKQTAAADQAAQQPREIKFLNGSEALDRFFEDVKTESYKPLPTGIKDIDAALGGGFIRKTLVMLGAAPGMGKTALAQWIFENMAAVGSKILYINLEMSREQLIARSISRQVYRDTQRSFDTNKILQGYKWTDQEAEIIRNSAEEYRRKYAGNMIYNPEGTTNNIESIMDTLEAAADQAKKEGKPAPIICIDYLQMIETNHRDAVEGLKNCIYRLKEYAKKNDTVIFVIVANNRNANMTGAAGLESGRDTSALEYAADVHLGLMYTAIYKRWTYTIPGSKGQPLTVDYTIDAIKEFKRAYNEGRRPEKMQDDKHTKQWEQLTLCINKNRFGVNERAAYLIFEAEHNIFKQTDNGRDDAAGFVPTGGRGAFDQAQFTTM